MTRPKSAFVHLAIDDVIKTASIPAFGPRARLTLPRAPQLARPGRGKEYSALVVGFEIQGCPPPLRHGQVV